MKRDHHEFERNYASTDIGCLLLSYFSEGNLKAEYLNLGADGFTRIYFAKEAECEIPVYYTLRKSIKAVSWLTLFDDTAARLHEYTSGINIDIYEAGRSLLIISK